MIRLYNQNILGNMPKEVKVANRNSLIADMIAEYRPDFCSFQECNPKTSRVGDTNMVALIAEQYAEACGDHAHENFTPVFYLKERFRQLDGGFLLYEGLNDGRSKSITWALFYDKREDRRLAVVSTHFWWKHRGDEDNEQREENARALGRLCREIFEKYDVPIIVSGDLNSGYVSEQGPRGYEMMLKEGFVDVRGIAEESTDSHTIHSYPKLSEAGVYTPGGKPYGTIDYVFTYGKDISVTKFAVLADDRARTSSDHCPLVVDFDL